MADSVAGSASTATTFGLPARSGFGNRVAELAQEIERIESAKAKVACPAFESAEFRPCRPSYGWS